MRSMVIPLNILSLRHIGATLILLVPTLSIFMYIRDLQYLLCHSSLKIWASFILFRKFLTVAACWCRCEKLLWWRKAHSRNLDHGLSQRCWYWGLFILQFSKAFFGIVISLVFKISLSILMLCRVIIVYLWSLLV